MDQICPECHVGIMLYDAPTKRYGCKKCGAFLTRDQLSDARFKAKAPEEDERRKVAGKAPRTRRRRRRTIADLAGATAHAPP